VPQNEQAGVVFKQPTTDTERKAVATTCSTKLKLDMPMLLDGMDNTVGEAYAGWPDRLYVVDEKSLIAYKGGPGPDGFKPQEVDDCLAKRFSR
jgi:hypothetical protein